MLTLSEIWSGRSPETHFQIEQATYAPISNLELFDLLETFIQSI